MRSSLTVQLKAETLSTILDVHFSYVLLYLANTMSTAKLVTDRPRIYLKLWGWSYSVGIQPIRL